MQTVIAIDPGERTGIAVYDRGALVFAITDEAPYSFIENLTRLYMPLAHILVEDWPERGRQTGWQLRVAQILDHVDNRVRYIRPSEWKGNPRSELTEQQREMCSDTHQRDAASMGRWFIRSESDNAPV